MHATDFVHASFFGTVQRRLHMNMKRNIFLYLFPVLFAVDSPVHGLLFCFLSLQSSLRWLHEGCFLF